MITYEMQQHIDEMNRLNAEYRVLEEQAWKADLKLIEMLCPFVVGESVILPQTMKGWWRYDDAKIFYIVENSQYGYKVSVKADSDIGIPEWFDIPPMLNRDFELCNQKPLSEPIQIKRMFQRVTEHRHAHMYR